MGSWTLGKQQLKPSSSTIALSFIMASQCFLRLSLFSKPRTYMKALFRSGLFAAAAMERPVIATRVGSLERDVRDRETGLLAPPEDAQALADAMVWMIEHPGERRRMGAAARETALRQNGPEAVAEATIAGYRRIARPGQARPES